MTMSDKRCVIIIPTHKSELNNYEIASLCRLFKICGDKYDIRFVIPDEGVDMNYYYNLVSPYSEKGIVHYYFPKVFFSSIRWFDILMTYPWFWSNFTDYDYALIYHLDCYILYDAIPYWMDKGYSQVECIEPANLIYGEAIFNGEGLRSVKGVMKALTDNREKLEQFYMTRFLGEYVAEKYGIVGFFKFGEDDFLYHILNGKEHIDNCYEFGWSSHKDEFTDKYGLPMMVHAINKCPSDKEWEYKYIGDFENDLYNCINNPNFESMYNLKRTY